MGLAEFADPTAAEPLVAQQLPEWSPPVALPGGDDLEVWEFPPVVEDPSAPAYRPRIPRGARLMWWTTGHRDFRLVVDSDPDVWATPDAAYLACDLPLFSGTEPVVKDGDVVPPPVGWGERSPDEEEGL